MNKERSRTLATELGWIIIASAVSVAVIVAIPFPVAFLVLAAVIGVSGFVAPLSRANRMSRSRVDTVAIHCHCLNCGTEHNDAACPNCGSKARKASFSESRTGEIIS